MHPSDAIPFSYSFFTFYFKIGKKLYENNNFDIRSNFSNSWNTHQCNKRVFL